MDGHSLTAAPLGRRLIAFLIDGAIGTALLYASYAVALGLTVLVVTQGAVTESALAVLVTAWVWLPLLTTVAWVVWNVRRTVKLHATPGKQLMGLVLVDAVTGRGLSGWRTLGRWLLRDLIVGLTLGVAGLVMLIVLANDRTGRGRVWHDLAAGTVVLDARALREPARPRAVSASTPRLAQVTLPGQLHRSTAEIPTLADVQPAAVPAAPIAAVPGGPVGRAAPPDGPLATYFRAAVDGPVVAGPPPVGGTDAADAADDDMTRHAPPRQPSLAPPADPRAHRLQLPSGTLVEVTGATLVGRNPEGRAGESVSALVPVSDPERRVSKTHVAISPAGGVLHLSDRASTNGTIVRHPDGRVDRAVPGEPLELSPGDEVVLGGGPSLLVR